MLKWYRPYMIFIGLAGQLSFFLQFATILTNKSAANVSLSGFTCGLVSVASWLIYGLLLKDKVLIISNVVATIGATMAVGAILAYS